MLPALIPTHVVGSQQVSSDRVAGHKASDRIQNHWPQDASESRLVPGGDLHRTRERDKGGAHRRPPPCPERWVCTSLAEQREVHEGTNIASDESPAGLSYLLQFG